MPKKKNFLGGMQNYNPNTGEFESRLVKATGEPATKANMPGGEDDKKSFKSFGKQETKKPTDYEGVKQTPYGYIYNIGKTSITDLKAERKSMNMKVDENKEYGYTVFKDGEEVYYPTFEEAYKSAKGKDDTFERINNGRMGIKNKETSSNKYNLKPSKEIRSSEMGSLSQEIGSTYNHLSDFYGVDLEELIYGKDGFMKTKYPNNFPDFRGDIIYSSKYWDEFEKWAKEEKGVDFTDRAWERYKLDPDYFEYKKSRNFVKEIREYGKKVEPNHPILKKERVDYDDDLPF